MSKPFHILRCSATSPVPPERLLRAALDDRADVRQVFKVDGRSRVRWVAAEGQEWVVKEMWDRPAQMWLSSSVRATPGWRMWRGAMSLAAVGLRVSLPVVLAGHGFGSWRGQTLVLPYQQGLPLSQALREAGPGATFDAQRLERRQRLATAIGSQAGRMIRAGYINRDYKASNLILDPIARQGGEPLIIDLDGLRGFRGWGRRGRDQITRMLANLIRSATAEGEVLPAEFQAFALALVQEVPRLGPPGEVVATFRGYAADLPARSGPAGTTGPDCR